MTPTLGKILMRVVGTLSGLFGLMLLCVGPFMLYHAITKHDGLMIGFTIFPLVLALYFLYVAYLVWFKFSPLAVRHVCGILAFYALMLMTNLFRPNRPSSENPWLAFVFLGGLVIVYFIYGATTRYFNRLLFPAPVSEVQS